MKKDPISYSFFEDVYAVVEQIPKSRVTSYGAIARYLGTAQSARMVGWALTRSQSLRKGLPAHRVVNRNGLLSGRQHFSTPTEMQERLEKEGIIVKEQQVQSFEKLFWDPALSLDI